MKLIIGFERCILCLENQIGDPEHIIPESIGGRLKADLLCNKCNHSFGGTFVGKLNHDTSIRFAFEYLKDRIPTLYKKAQEKELFFGKAEDGSIIKASHSKGKLKVKAGKGANDSIIMDTNEAKGHIANRLRKFNLSPDEVKLYQDRFEAMKEKERLELPTGTVYIKQPGPQLFPDMSDTHIDHRLLALIAYEFLALFEGNNIFREYFDPIRHYILHGVETNRLIIKDLQGGAYETCHVINIDIQADSTTVYIRFFRWIVYAVIFNNLAYSGPDAVYFEDLEPTQSLLSETKSDFNKGIFIR